MRIAQKLIYLLIVILFVLSTLNSCAHFQQQPTASAQPILPRTVSDDSARILYTSAKEHLDSQQYIPAIAEFTQFNQNYPGHVLTPYCNYHLTECYIALGEIIHAGAALCSIQIREIKTANYFKEQGWAEKAAEYLDRYLAQPISKRQRAEALLQKGAFLQILTDGLGARVAFEKAYQLAPKSDAGKKALYYQGLSLFYEQTYSGVSQAQEIFHQVTKQYPKDPIAINSDFFQTITHWQWRSSENKLMPFEQFIQQHSNSPWTILAYFHMGRIAAFDLRDPKSGLIYFDKTLDLLTTSNLQGEDPPVSYWLEEALIQTNLLYRTWNGKMEIYLNYYGFDSALAFGKAMQASFPEDHGVHQLGKLVPLIALQWQKKHTESVSAADSYLAQYPASANKWIDNRGTALYLKACALHQLAQNTEAISMYNQLVNEYPESECGPAGFVGLGMLYETMHDYQNAVLTYDRIINQFPRYITSCWAYTLKAKALGKLERYHEALATLNNFFLKCSNRYDCPKDIIQSAKELKAEYQQKLGIAKKSEEDL